MDRVEVSVVELRQAGPGDDVTERAIRRVRVADEVRLVRALKLGDRVEMGCHFAHLYVDARREQTIDALVEDLVLVAHGVTDQILYGDERMKGLPKIGAVQRGGRLSRPIRDGERLGRMSECTCVVEQEGRARR